MSNFRRQRPSFKTRKEGGVEWGNFKRGLNLIFRPTELRPDELAQADNLMLTGEGVPTGRWGSDTYNLAGETGSVRLLAPYYDPKNDVRQLIHLTDDGLVTKLSGGSYSIIQGYSYPSGADVTWSQIGGSLFLSSPSTPLVKYSGATLIPYLSISAPTGVAATNLSGASGLNTWSWIVTANSLVGETDSSVAFSLASLPQDLKQTAVKVSWSPISAASGVLTGYNIYRGRPGDESWVGTVDKNSTNFIDVGDFQSNIRLAPVTNTTGGPKAKYNIKFDDRIILAGFDDDPSLVLISGRYPYHDRFNWADGGGFVYVDPDGGEEITGLGIASNQGASQDPSSILVFKDNSVHRIILGFANIGSYVVLDPQTQLLTSSNGCSSHHTILQMENDTVYFGRKGLYVVGQEPNFLNQLRTNEISARIRPYIQALSPTDFNNAHCAYIDNKLILTFPTRKECIIYDRERAAFMGPWSTPWGIDKWLKYFDSDDREIWLAGTNEGPYIRRFSPSYQNDSGEAIVKTLNTKKEDFGLWSILKLIKVVYVMLRNVRGAVTVNIKLQDKNGDTLTAKTISISANSVGDSGYGSDLWGDAEYGDTEPVSIFTTEEIHRWAQIYKQARIIQIEVSSTEVNANWEFLSTRMTADSLTDKHLPLSLQA